jgi:hypothetical protein
MKAKELSKKAIMHLVQDLGYESDYAIDEIYNSPYLIINEISNRLFAVNTRSAFYNSSEKEVCEQQIMKMQKPIPPKQKMSPREKYAIKLCKKLNSPSYRDFYMLGKHEGKIIFNYQSIKNADGVVILTRVYPVTQGGHSSIYYNSMKVIMDFCEKENIKPQFTNFKIHDDTDSCQTPCVIF